MERHTTADGRSISRVVVTAFGAGALVAMGIDLWVSQLSPASLLRSLVSGSLVLLAAMILRKRGGAAVFQVYIAAVFGVLSLIDAIFDVEFSIVGPEATLALLVLTSVTFVAIRAEASPGPVIRFAAAIAVWTIAIAIFAEPFTTRSVGFMFLGVLGAAVVLWVVSQLINSLALASETDAKYARIQKALAGCSHALLNRGTPEPLTTALRVLLDATDAYYAYIDVNRSDDTGKIHWEIVAEAARDSYPGQNSGFVSGDYEQMEDLRERLSSGQPAEIITSQLPRPVRDRYEAEGIKAELVAPIMIGSTWKGSLGYTDHIREGMWTTIEIDGLMRAAEMVGAYWEREAAREGLMELAQAKDRFIAAVSHELRTPLAAVVGFAAALAQGTESYSTEELAEMSAVIYDQSLELTHLVDDLLTAERAASGNLTIKPTDVDLLDECRDIVGSAGLDLDVSIDGGSVTTRADSLRTRQIIRNLLTNATRYGGERVEISLSSSATTATVTVRDNGTGVHQLDAERIFEPYYRSHEREGASAPDSVGLGLAVARQLARLMGGDIVYRRTDGWTHFELTLPLAGEPAALVG